MTAGSHVSSSTMFDSLCGALVDSVGEVLARSIVTVAMKRCGLSGPGLETVGLSKNLMAEVARGLELCCKNDGKKKQTLLNLSSLMDEDNDLAAEAKERITVEIKIENDIVVARNFARSMARKLGFHNTDQIKIATAVSEIARNIIKYAERGRMTMDITRDARIGIRIEACDEGPGIRNLEEVMSRNYRSRTGLGIGLSSCKKLMDGFTVTTDESTGTSIVMTKYL